MTIHGEPQVEFLVRIFRTASSGLKKSSRMFARTRARRLLGLGLSRNLADCQLSKCWHIIDIGELCLARPVEMGDHLCRGNVMCVPAIEGKKPECSVTEARKKTYASCETSS